MPLLLRLALLASLGVGAVAQPTDSLAQVAASTSATDSPPLADSTAAGRPEPLAVETLSDSAAAELDSLAVASLSDSTETVSKAST